MSLISFNAFGIEYMPKVELDLVCSPIDAVSYQPDRTVSNVALDRDPLEVKIRPTYLSTKYSWASSDDRYDYISGMYDKTKDYFNMSFESKYGGTWGTKNVTFMFDGKNRRAFLISTEPLMEKGTAQVRTHYYGCK